MYNVLDNSAISYNQKHYASFFGLLKRHTGVGTKISEKDIGSSKFLIENSVSDIYFINYRVGSILFQNSISELPSSLNVVLGTYTLAT